LFKPCNTLIFLFLGSSVLAQYRTDDLRPRWMQYAGGRYLPYDKADAIHFRLEETDRRDTLVIQGKDFHVFVNNQWLREGQGEVRFSADSLMNQYTGLMVSVFSPHATVRTYLRHPLLDEAEERITPVQKRFVQLAFMILTALFAAALNVNRSYGAKLLFDPVFYFRDAIPLGRISSLLNTMYTFFGALVWGFILTANQASLPFLSFPQSLEGLFLYWFSISFVLYFAVWMKTVWMVFLAWVYNLSGSKSAQSYQISRLWLALGIFLCISWAGYALAAGRVHFPSFFKYLTLFFFLAGYWLVFLALAKLKNLKITIQLFSYFCASEVLPFLIFIKVLLF